MAQMQGSMIASAWPRTRSKLRHGLDLAHARQHLLMEELHAFRLLHFALLAAAMLTESAHGLSRAVSPRTLHAA